MQQPLEMHALPTGDWCAKKPPRCKEKELSYVCMAFAGDVRTNGRMGKCPLLAMLTGTTCEVKASPSNGHGAIPPHVCFISLSGAVDLLRDALL